MKSCHCEYGIGADAGICGAAFSPLYLDGREVARVTAEYTDAELEEISRRKGRGG